MPTEKNPEEDHPHKGGTSFFGGLGAGLKSLLITPDPEAEGGKDEDDKSTATAVPAEKVAVARVPQPVPSIQIDQEKFNKYVAAITQNHPGLVVLTDALVEARELELDAVKTAKKISMALTKAGIGVMPLLDDFTKALQEIDAERQKFLNASASALDQEVGALRRKAEQLGNDNVSIKAQIASLQKQMQDNEAQCVQLNAQADEKEHAHKEREAVKLATVAAVTDHFNALKDMVQRNNGSH